ncbi:MAG: quinol:cytochrome C oxidoreductase [Bacteroidota bacterium]
MEHSNISEEQFDFNAKTKKSLLITLVVGVVLLILGILTVSGSGGHGESDGHALQTIQENNLLVSLDDQPHGDDSHSAGHEEGHHGFHWSQRLMSNIWINNVYFTGLAIIGVFFFAIQYVAQAGWSVPVIRIPSAFGTWLPIAAVLMIISFILFHHDLFHWTHSYLYDESDPRYDKILAGKTWYLSLPFYIVRMVIYFVVWIILARIIRKKSLEEDITGGDTNWFKLVKFSAIFVVFFAVSSSMSAWDWVMSIDPHWFSTMFGWYVFASWFVAGLAAITLTTSILKDKGYLSIVTDNHLHDLGKFIFAFSIFWTYIWFSQFLLIYYANIPEETIYFVERLENALYRPIFFINLILNFFFPFLFLMTRESKRHTIMLKIAAVVILLGHWIDFYLMITPGTLKYNGGFGFMEIGVALIYLSAFLFVVLNSLSKAPLIAKNHPMLKESLHHHI